MKLMMAEFENNSKVLAIISWQVKALPGGQLQINEPKSEHDEVETGQPLDATSSQVVAREGEQPLRQQPPSELDNIAQSLYVHCSQVKALEGGRLQRGQPQSELDQFHTIECLQLAGGGT